MKLLFAMLAHDDRPSLEEAVVNARVFCPSSRLLLYNSGSNRALGRGLEVEHFRRPRQLSYARVTPFFLHLFERLVKDDDPFDAVVNLESDLLFIRRGFERFVERELRQVDYLAPILLRKRPLSTRWRPMRSLRPEFDDWFDLFGFRYWHGAFSPGQVFSRNYVRALIHHPQYRRIKSLVAKNRSFSLQEVLFPTLTDFLALRLGGYPDRLTPINRYRPYQAPSGVERALATRDAFFVHPIRRNPTDPARVLIRHLCQREGRKGSPE